jgi:hypothetical protein
MFLLEFASIPFRASGIRLIEFHDGLDKENEEPDRG